MDAGTKDGAHRKDASLLLKTVLAQDTSQRNEEGRMKRSSPLQRKTRLRARRPKPRTHKLVVRLTGKALEQLRLDCYRRDNCRCQECGIRTDPFVSSMAPNSYHMAHIKAKRNGGDTLDNVRALCGDCHRAEHGNPLPRSKQ